MHNINVDIDEKENDTVIVERVPSAKSIISEVQMRKPSHCSPHIIDILNEPIDKESKDNTLDGLKLLWECRPKSKTNDIIKATSRSKTVRKSDEVCNTRLSLPSIAPPPTLTNEEQILFNDYEVLKYNIKILHAAHSESMQLNGLFDRILTLGSISATFITTMLLALKDVGTGSNNNIYITECATSGLATGLVAMNNKFENGAKKQQHLDIVNKLRKLQMEISVESQTRENYNKSKIQFMSDLGDVTIFKSIREKYEIDNLSGGLF